MSASQCGRPSDGKGARLRPKNPSCGQSHRRLPERVVQGSVLVQGGGDRMGLLHVPVLSCLSNIKAIRCADTGLCSLHVQTFLHAAQLQSRLARRPTARQATKILHPS